MHIQCLVSMLNHPLQLRCCMHREWGVKQLINKITNSSKKTRIRVAVAMSNGWLQGWIIPGQSWNIDNAVFFPNNFQLLWPSFIGLFSKRSIIVVMVCLETAADLTLHPNILPPPFMETRICAIAIICKQVYECSKRTAAVMIARCLQWTTAV